MKFKQTQSHEKYMIAKQKVVNMAKVLAAKDYFDSIEKLEFNS